MWMLLKKLKNEHVIKKMEEQKNQTIRPLVSFRMFQKIYERCLYDQIYSSFDQILSMQFS